MPLLTLKELSDISPLFRGRVGRSFGQRLMKALAVDRVNDLYDRHSHLSGIRFTEAILEDLGINYQILNADLLRLLREVFNKRGKRCRSF